MTSGDLEIPLFKSSVEYKTIYIVFQSIHNMNWSLFPYDEIPFSSKVTLVCYDCFEIRYTPCKQK